MTALTLPGRVIIRVFLYVPATGRERDANGVCLSDELRRRCTNPGAWRSRSELTACGWQVKFHQISTILNVHLRSHVASPKASPTGGEDEIHVLLVRPRKNYLLDFGAVVRDNLRVRTSYPSFTQDVLDLWARLVERCILKGRIAD